MKRMIIILCIVASMGMLVIGCKRTPTTAPPPPPAPTSPDQVSANASVVSINGTALALSSTMVTLNGGSNLATDGSGNATIVFVSPNGTCELDSGSQMTTRPDATTVFDQGMGSSYCNFAGNQPKQITAGGSVLITSPDPAIRIVVTSGKLVNVAIYEGDATVTFNQVRQSLVKNQEIQVPLSVAQPTLVPRTATFTENEKARFSKLGVVPVPVPQAKGKIGLVTNVAGVNDKAFNQSAWEGIQRAAKDFGMDVKFVESKQPTDYGKNIDQFAAEKYNAIITVGSLMGDATAAKAKQYPNVRFAIIDSAYSPTKGDKNCPETVKDCYADGGLKNVTSLMFQEDQAGFLAGVLAGGMTKAGVVCTVAGPEIPPVVRYVVGFQNGARWSKPDVKNLNVYIPSFTDAARGKESGQSMISQGCDVVFGVGGNTGNGGLLAAKEKGVLAIGVDVDQYNTNPEVKTALVTSAMKNVDVAVYNYLRSVSDGSVTAGILTGNVQNGGVGLAPFHDWDSKIPQSVRNNLNTALDGLKSGAIKTGYKP